MKKYVKKKRYLETGKLTDWVAYLCYHFGAGNARYYEYFTQMIGRRKGRLC